jgi:small basic protein (TIGR04137 family)
MSVDPSLKIKNALTRHRNVLTRAERIEKLKDEERWSEGGSVLGLPKVAHRKTAAGKKSKTEAEAAAGAAPGAPGAAPAPAAAAGPKAGTK